MMIARSVLADLQRALGLTTKAKARKTTHASLGLPSCKPPNPRNLGIHGANVR
jgi:hypothetical protein